MEEDGFNLTLANHAGEVLDYVSGLQWSESFSDVTIKCLDGSVRSHCAIISSMSPFLHRLLAHEDDPVIHLPDVPIEEVKCLLSLLYSGSVNLYKQ
jgi:hypothetical protein